MSTIPRLTTDTHPPDEGSWASERLLLGQVSVGFWVLFATGLLVAQPSLPQFHPGVQWAAVCILYLLLQLPFDAWGGLYLPRRHGRWQDSTSEWLRRWSRGALLHTATFFAVGAATLYCSRVTGPVGGIVALLTSMVLLLSIQGHMARYMGSMQVLPKLLSVSNLDLGDHRLAVISCRDTGFVGGWVGLPGLEQLYIPARWTEQLGPKLLDAALRRRVLALHTGMRTRGLIGAVLYNLAGIALTTWALDLTLTSADDLLLLASGTTLWTFLGILTLPTASRQAVYALDRATLEPCELSTVRDLISTLDRDQEDEHARGRVVETIFHPVPASGHRITSLEQRIPVYPWAAWRITRTMLYVSWGSLSVLGRAVHCNCGRPELWAIHPGD